MTLLRSLPRTFRYVEWIYITAHLGMGFNSPGYSLQTVAIFYSAFFTLSWLFPINRPYWQRLSYIILALTTAICARRIGIDFGLFMPIYISKSYFLLNRRLTIVITIITEIVWTISEYLANVEQLSFSLQDTFDAHDPLKFFIFSLLGYTAANVFVIMFSAMMIAEAKSRQRADTLEQQLETLSATLERTRIAREIHDSLGHTLTDLDIQLAVAQQLRVHNLEQSFQAVDIAKMLAGQCIEDVSQALNRMRQSDFDLNQSLTALLEQVRQNSAMLVQWEVNLPQLDLHKSYQIYCIIKEGMINIQKHARASQVSFRGHLTPAGIILDLKDNGVGFDPNKLHSGFGIQGMVERVQLLGGNLKLETALAQGTQIQVIIPI